MDGSRFKKRRMFWIPVITGWIIFAFTMIYALNIQNENNQFYQRITDRKLGDIREIFSASLDQRIITLNRVAEKWKIQQGISFKDWAVELKGYLKDFEGLLEVTWINNENGTQWVISKDQEARIERVPAPGKRNLSQQTQVVVEEYRPGIQTFVVTIPTYTNGELSGQLNAVIDFKGLVHSTISRYLDDVYRLVVFSNTQKIYTYGNSSELYSFNASELLRIYGLELDFRLMFNDEIYNISMFKNTFFILTIGIILSLMIPSFLFLFYHVHCRNQVLQRLLKVKAEFLSNMSHEIRTPLHGVIAYISLLEPMMSDPKEEKYLRRIHTSSKLLLDLVDNILDYSKIDSGKLELEIKPNDVKSLIYEIYDVFVQMANEKDVKFHLYYDDSIPKEVLCDALRLKQILMNLTNNAIKFTHEGEVSLRVLRVADQRIRFEIVDTGVGISKENQKNIFEKFSQEDNTTTRKYGGSGLGLAICQQLVKAMGGNISCISEKNEGSTFWFEIPLKTPSEIGKRQKGS